MRRKIDYLSVFKHKINLKQHFDFREYLRLRKIIKNKRSYKDF